MRTRLVLASPLLLSALVPSVAKLSLFQRTPQWIAPQENAFYTDAEKSAYRADPIAFRKMADGLAKVGFLAWFAKAAAASMGGFSVGALVVGFRYGVGTLYLKGQPPVQLPTLGGSMPFGTFSDDYAMPTVGVSIVNYDNNQHGPDENLRLQNLWEGIEMLAAIMTMPK